MTQQQATPTEPGGWVVREAEPDDVPAIDALIRQLAVSQGHPEAVTAAPYDLQAALFGEGATTHCFVAAPIDPDGESGPVGGIALWFVIYSTWVGRHGIWLEDLVVDEAARGHGVGQALMQRLAQECLRRGYARLDWTVLTDNEGGQRFYDRLGARSSPRTPRLHRLDGADLAAGPPHACSALSHSISVSA